MESTNFTLATPRTLRASDRVLRCLLAAAFAACFANVLVSLVQQWLTNDVYAHGFLIPVISGYLLYQKRASLAATTMEPAIAAGSLLFALGLSLLLLGHVGGVVALEYLSLLISLAALVLLFFGRAMLRETWGALAYLLFMIPIWDGVTGAFQGSFQLFSADIGTGLLRLAAIPVRRDGVYLELPNVTLHVAEACSGVNFVVAILAITIPQAHLQLKSRFLRLFVALFAVLVALVTNGVRVALIGVLSYTGLAGSEIHGPGHVLQGMSVAVAGFVVMFLTIHFLARRTRHGDAEVQQNPELLPPIRRGARTILTPRLVGIAALVLIGAAALQRVDFSKPVDLLAPIPTFRADLGAWRAGPNIAAPDALRVPGADAEVSRSYASADGRTVQLYAAYFRYQVQDKELIGERMSRLHQSAQPVTLKLPDGNAFRAQETMNVAGNHKQYVLFWYDINGRQVVNRYAAKAWTIWDSISRRRSNGALVMLIADLPDGALSADVIRETRALGGLAAPALSAYLPR